jgi:hypothetical protein
MRTTMGWFRLNLLFGLFFDVNSFGSDVAGLAASLTMLITDRNFNMGNLWSGVVPTSLVLAPLRCIFILPSLV